MAKREESNRSRMRLVRSIIQLSRQEMMVAETRIVIMKAMRNGPIPGFTFGKVKRMCWWIASGVWEEGQTPRLLVWATGTMMLLSTELGNPIKGSSWWTDSVEHWDLGFGHFKCETPMWQRSTSVRLAKRHRLSGCSPPRQSGLEIQIWESLAWGGF